MHPKFSSENRLRRDHMGDLSISVSSRNRVYRELD